MYLINWKNPKKNTETQKCTKFSTHPDSRLLPIPILDQKILCLLLFKHKLKKKEKTNPTPLWTQPKDLDSLKLNSNTKEDPKLIMMLLKLLLLKLKLSWPLNKKQPKLELLLTLRLSPKLNWTLNLTPKVKKLKRNKKSCNGLRISKTLKMLTKN